jgi:hypothetical protein
MAPIAVWGVTQTVLVIVAVIIAILLIVLMATRKPVQEGTEPDKTSASTGPATSDDQKESADRADR